ncbi:MAG: pseudouridine synthase [Planctomycetota bacterium]
MHRDDKDSEYKESTEPMPKEEHRPRRPLIEVIHHDEDVIVLAKPPSLWLDVAAGEATSVTEQLIKQGLLADGPDPMFVYPLDPPVSGILILAKSEVAARNLADQVKAVGIQLTALAIVRGPVMKNEGTIDFKLTDLAAGPKGKMKVDAIRGHDAVTTWTVRDQFVGFALLECRTQPVMPHQFRVHLEAAGIPLAVDPLYSGATKLLLSSFKAGYQRSHRRPERPLIDRVSLHVASVEFRHPQSGEACRYESVLPKDFKATLHQLERFGRMPK